MAKQSKQVAKAPEAKKVLHVGCGHAGKDALPMPFRSKEWQEIRLDINEKVKPDIVASMLDMAAVETGSMDGLFSSHNLEHLYPHQVPVALKEFFRVLKPGGVLVVTLPDIQAVAAYIAEGRLENKLYDSPAGAISPIDILYGHRKAIAGGNHFMAHRGAFSAVSLAKHLAAAGFCNLLIQRDWVNLWAVGYKLPKTHPQRKDAVRIENKNITGPKVAPLPFWYQRQLQLQANAGIRSDELQSEPQLWKPLGLNKE